MLKAPLTFKIAGDQLEELRMFADSLTHDYGNGPVAATASPEADAVAVSAEALAKVAKLTGSHLVVTVEMVAD